MRKPYVRNDEKWWNLTGSLDKKETQYNKAYHSPCHISKSFESFLFLPPLFFVFCYRNSQRDSQIEMEATEQEEAAHSTN